MLFSEKDYWNTRYQLEQTGWDLQQVSPPLKAYFDQLTDKHIRLLIPGCGSGYEVGYLLQQGFTNITVVDIAPLAVAALQRQYAQHTGVQIIEADFFTHQGQYDLIIEQTFFCAIPPRQRPAYVATMHQLLANQGKLVGVLFNRQFEQDGPPYGGDQNGYENLFQPSFQFKTLQPCYNSIAPRQGSELFMIAVRQSA